MTRVDIGSWCTLYHADATEIIDVLREHAPAVVIMDPPYGIGLHNAGYRRRNQTVVVSPSRGATYRYGPDGPAQQRRGDTRIAGDDGTVDISPWLDFAPQCITWGLITCAASYRPVVECSHGTSSPVASRGIRSLT